MRRAFSIPAFVTALAMAAGAATAQPSAPSPAGPVIQDPAEYKAYMLALNTGDPGAKAGAMEAFVARFPGSIVKIDALEQAMAAYQQANNAAKLEAVARRILAIQPDAERPRAVVVALVRARATAASDPQASLALADQAAADALHGLAGLPAWLKADGVSDADKVRARDQMTAIFNGALGYRSLTHKDYVAAKSFYIAALKAEPDDLSNAYQLAIADLQSRPVDPAGFWWAARAYDLAGAGKNGAAQTGIAAFARPSYHNYHGGDDGWDQIVAGAATLAAPPVGFTVAPAPTPAEIAVKAVADNDPKTMSFSDWEFVLALRDASPANRGAADRVWAAIEALQANNVKLKLQVKVIAATTNGFDGALTDENQKADHADLRVTLTTPSAKPLSPGALISVVGRLTGYTPQPFRFTFASGELTP